MRKTLIITLIGMAVSLYSILSYANTSNYCPLMSTFDPPSTPAFWTWKTIASLTPVAFNPQKQYQFYAEFFLNDQTSSLFKRAVCIYVSNERNCTPLNCPSFVLVSNMTFSKPLNTSPWNTILPNQPANSFACHPTDWETNQQSPLSCILAK